jgi:hypothetical protein
MDLRETVVGKPERKKFFADLGVHGRIILILTSKKLGIRMW